MSDTDYAQVFMMHNRWFRKQQYSRGEVLVSICWTVSVNQSHELDKFVDKLPNFDDLWGWSGVTAHKNFPLRYLAGSLTFRVSFFRKISLIGTSPSEQDKNVNNIGSFQNLLETRRCRFAEYCAIFQNRKFPHQHNGCVMGILKQLAALIYFHFPTN